MEPYWAIEQKIPGVMEKALSSLFGNHQSRV